MKQSLQEYAQNTRDDNTRCLVCAAPDDVRTAVEENESAPIHRRLPRHIVAAWAKDEHDTVISTDSIYRHMRSHI